MATWGLLKSIQKPSAYNSDMYISGKRTFPIFEDFFSKAKDTEKRLDSDDVSCFTVRELKDRCPALLPKPMPKPTPGCPPNYGPIFQGPAPKAVKPWYRPRHLTQTAAQDAQDLESRYPQYWNMDGEYQKRPGVYWGAGKQRTGQRGRVDDQVIHDDEYLSARQAQIDEASLSRMQATRERQDARASGWRTWA